MKKCASCSKDLPDAALHCVFCGAKQPPAPATTGGLAKTVMGSYSASDMMDHLKGQQAGGPAPRGVSGPTPGPAFGAPAPAPYQRPAPASAPPLMGAPMPMPMPPPPSGGPAPFQPPGVPVAPSAAPTLFVAPTGGSAPPQAGFGGPAGPNAKTVAIAPAPQSPFPPPSGPYNAGPGPGPGPIPVGQPAPFPPAGMPQPAPLPRPMPLPQPGPPPPYLSSQAARAARPLEPWKDSLRLMMFVWGGALLAVFAAPLSIDPLVFNWDVILNSEGKEKLPPLIMAAVGLLSIVLALIPTSPAPRGLIAGALGLVGVALPLVLAEVTEWKLLVPLAGTLLMIPGLLIREEYRESILPRIMVTLGVIAVLLPLLVPAHSKLPLVELFKAAIDAPGKAKVIPLLQITYIVIAVMTLLAWLPAPASAGGKVFAWILLLWPALMFLTTMVLADQIVDMVTKTPAAVLVWVAGRMVESVYFLGTAYAVLVGYGFATVLGKKLE